MIRLTSLSPVAALALLFSMGCGDDGGSPVDAPVAIDAPVAAGCRDSAGCPLDEGCVGPNDTVCGVPPQEQCASSADCPNGDTCHAMYDSCSPDGVGSMCAPACTPGEVCGDGFVCNADGACMPVACDDPAYDCRGSEVCDPGSIDLTGPVHAVTHGCTIVACAGDDDTPCPGDSVCVNNYCQDGLGTCSPPVP